MRQEESRPAGNEAASKQVGETDSQTTGAGAMGEVALAYATRAGWPIFPVYWTTGDACGCGKACGRDAGKHPITRNGVKNATTDADTIREWWARYPQANIGLATGAPGPDVLDFDVKNGGRGVETFKRLQAAGLLRGAQAVVVSPSGGWHLYFPASGHSGRGIPDEASLDIQTGGKYVLAPYSSVFGRRYRLTNRRPRQHPGVRPADIPAIRALLAPQEPAAPRPSPRQKPAGALRPGDDFNARADWSDDLLLPGAGWTYARPHGHAHLWRRPGGTGQKHAITGGDQGDVLHVFTPNAPPFEKDITYSKFEAYALLHHNGDRSAAARELRRLGYGTNTTPFAGVLA